MPSHVRQRLHHSPTVSSPSTVGPTGRRGRDLARNGSTSRESSVSPQSPAYSPSRDSSDHDDEEPPLTQPSARKGKKSAHIVSDDEEPPLTQPSARKGKQRARIASDDRGYNVALGVKRSVARAQETVPPMKIKKEQKKRTRGRSELVKAVVSDPEKLIKKKKPKKMNWGSPDNAPCLAYMIAKYADFYKLFGEQATTFTEEVADEMWD